MGEGPVVLGLSNQGARQVLAFLEAHRDGQALTMTDIATRDDLIYMLENHLFADFYAGQVML